MARGDVLLFKSAGDVAGELICAFTKGPYSHVEVDLGDGTSVGAHSEDGVRVRPLDEHNPRVVRVCLADKAKPADVERGVRFLLGEVGNPYGWVDIANQALKVLGVPYYIGRVNYYDCSNLVVRYLLIAAPGIDFGELGEAPALVTPNDIARAVGLLAAEREIKRRNPLAALGAFVKFAIILRRVGLAGIGHPNGQ